MRLSYTLHFGLVFQLLQVHLVAAFGPLKYRLWFRGWRDGYYVGDICAKQIGTYWANNSTSPWTCQLALDCIIGNTSGSALQEMASSLVVLGLTPTMLSQLGPKLSESSMLSYRRPGLSFLLSMGAPTVFPGRIFTYESPFETLKVAFKDQPVQRYLPSMRPLVKRPKVIGFIEYVVALGAICNIIDQSIQLGWRSVLSWACNTTWTPMAWVLFPGLIHVIAAAAFHRIPKSVKQPGQTSEQDEMGWRRRPFWGSFDELRACHAHTKRTIIAGSPGLMTLVLNNVAQFLVVIHIVLGSVIFSSCQFLRFVDAIPVILRYTLSTLVCQFINAYELHGMSETLQVELECMEHTTKKKTTDHTYPGTSSGQDFPEQQLRSDKVPAGVSVHPRGQPSQLQATQQLEMRHLVPLHGVHGPSASVPTTWRNLDLPLDRNRLNQRADQASTSFPHRMLRPSKSYPN